MKNYYELTKNERGKYLKEFKKTSVGKEMNFKRICILIIVVSCYIVGGFVSGLQDGSGTMVNQETEIFINTMYNISLIGLLIFSGFTAYMNVNFTAWLKNKYDIKRW